MVSSPYRPEQPDSRIDGDQHPHSLPLILYPHSTLESSLVYDTEAELIRCVWQADLTNVFVSFGRSRAEHSFAISPLHSSASDQPGFTRPPANPSCVVPTPSARIACAERITVKDG